MVENKYMIVYSQSAINEYMTPRGITEFYVNPIIDYALNAPFHWFGTTFSLHSTTTRAITQEIGYWETDLCTKIVRCPWQRDMNEISKSYHAAYPEVKAYVFVHQVYGDAPAFFINALCETKEYFTISVTPYWIDHTNWGFGIPLDMQIAVAHEAWHCFTGDPANSTRTTLSGAKSLYMDQIDADKFLAGKDKYGF